MVVEAPRVDVAANLLRVMETIESTSLRCGRRPEDVTLVAVSKTQPVGVMQAAFEAGVRHFGENRVQEAAEKIDQIASSRRITWHLIGTLQSNKVGRALDLFNMIHSIDCERLAVELSNRNTSDRRVPVLLQVNIAGESTKHGLSVEEAPDAARRIARLPGLALLGLMAIAPLNHDPEASRPWFRALRRLRDRLADEIVECDWRHLSMGMSHDYPVAIEEGATLLRVGSAIFGPRA